MREAYLDIETTGLSLKSDITVIGVCIADGVSSRFTQFVGEEISTPVLMEALSGVDTIYTYNGSRFDLPFIQWHLGVNLASLFQHCDLMYRCWSNNLYGGLKRVEMRLGVERRLKDVNGYEAIRLWWRYRNDYDQDALLTLLEYNREDVLNLKVLKEKLS